MIDTARLHLRRLLPEDAPAVLAYRRDPQVAAFQAWGVIDAGAVERDLRARAPFGFLSEAGPWFALGIEHAGTLVGDASARAPADAPGTVEIGYTIAPAWQRRGFATEAVGALVAWLLRGPGRARVVATVDDRNVASIGVLARLGFACVARAETKHAGAPAVYLTYERRGQPA